MARYKIRQFDYDVWSSTTAAYTNRQGANRKDTCSRRTCWQHSFWKQSHRHPCTNQSGANQSGTNAFGTNTSRKMEKERSGSPQKIWHGRGQTDRTGRPRQILLDHLFQIWRKTDCISICPKKVNYLQKDKPSLLFCKNPSFLKLFFAFPRSLVH